MGLVISTGTFRFIPPNPSIDGISSYTGHINNTVRLFGNDLDYIDTVTLANETCNFNLIDLNNLDVTIPENPQSGYIIASSIEFNVTGNQIIFYPIPKIETFSPSNSASGEVITVVGKAINSATGAYLHADPLIDDVPFIFSQENNLFVLTTNSTIQNSNIVLTQNININSYTGEYKIKNIAEYNISSGRRTEVTFNDLNKKYFENHVFSYPKITTSNIQTFITGLDTGFSIYPITLPSGRADSEYCVFYSPVLSGRYYNSFISGKNNNLFYLNFDSILEEPISVYAMIMNQGQFTFDTGIYISSGISIQSGISISGVEFSNDKLYKPFLLTSCEYSGEGSGYKYNISNLNKNHFDVNIPNSNGHYNLTLNYCRIINPKANLNTFSFVGASGGYYKIYLYTGDINSFQERVEVLDYQNVNKNEATFKIPYTDYYINGKINLIGPENINSESDTIFYETPLPTGIFPPFGIKGQNVVISGKSFKKPILNDGTGDYNYITVRFRYADDVFKQNTNSFSSDFILLDFNTLSGEVPLSNFPSGRYAIQMIAENGSLYE